MTAAYFRALVARCNEAARSCSDSVAKEEFRRLAEELTAKLRELEASPSSQIWKWVRRSPDRGSG
jgi:hypothetical protein